jgi:hypothetical protein
VSTIAQWRFRREPVIPAAASAAVTPAPAARGDRAAGSGQCPPCAAGTKRAPHAGGLARPTSRCARAPSTPRSGACPCEQAAGSTGLPAEVNVLDTVTTLAGPNSVSVAYPNDDTLYSFAFLDLRGGPQLLSVPSVSGRSRYVGPRSSAPHAPGIPQHSCSPAPARPATRN